MSDASKDLVGTGVINRVFILGAGFSRYAGLPVQAEFTSALLEGKALEELPSKPVTDYIKRFVGKVFKNQENVLPLEWPDFEDIFTCIDLSANTGHNLGTSFPASELRTVRRALIYRIITMLRERYLNGDHEGEWLKLNSFINRIDATKSAFICTNWDTVLEDRLADCCGIKNFDYGCDASPALLRSALGEIKEQTAHKGQSVQVIKIHGSTNWLYCDNCRQMLSFPSSETYKVADQLLRQRDWEAIHRALGNTPTQQLQVAGYECNRCHSESLGTRLATFSFLKALDFPMFQKSWFRAEELLVKAKSWIFIGYSLPFADYEFKYLLKRIQLSRAEALKIFVISGGSDPEKIKATFRNYRGFFGTDMQSGKTFFETGLNEQSIETIFDDAG